MTQEEKQLLLKDICARLPYGVKFILSGGNINNIYTIKGIDLIVTDEGNWEYAVTAKGIAPIEIKNIKPYLRPMSSMTKADEKFYNQFFDWYEQPLKDIVILIEWLNANHFDYRGLIPMGLALEAPEGLYGENC